MKPRLLLLLLLFLVLLALPVRMLAQTDTEFWFAVPYVTTGHDGPTTADLNLTATDEVNVTTVTITQPGNPTSTLFPMTVTINPGVALTETVSFTQAEMLTFSNNLYTGVVSNSALYISSDREITAYYEINKVDNNPAIFSLKGDNALGYNFWTPFQEKWDNSASFSPSPFSEILIVATEDNTVVTVELPTGIADYSHTAGATYTITLDRGETYMIVPALDGSIPDQSASAHLIGTHVTSDKPIAITLGDDSVQKGNPSGTAMDYCGDQHIPTENINGKAVIGYEYIIMKGQIWDGTSGHNEKAYVMGTVDNTTVTITYRDGSTYTITGLDAGEQSTIEILAADNDYYVHVLADQPVYLLHIAGFGNELGESILPTIDGCTGSLSVSFTRSKTDAFYLNLMTKSDAIDSFYISIDGAAPVAFLDASYFEQAGTSDWYVLKNASTLMDESVIPTGSVTRITNTKNVFHLGYFNGKTSGGGCVYGYFSDYNELEASANVEDEGNYYFTCGVDSIQLKADGGLSYQWSPTDYLDDPTSQNPVVTVPREGISQVYAVDIEQPCDGNVTLYVYVYVPETPNAFLTVDYDNGCAPLTLDIEDASTGGVDGYMLDLGDGTPVIDSSSAYLPNVPLHLTHTFNNTSDTIIEYHVTYTIVNSYGCMDDYIDTITVMPQIISVFEPASWTDTTVCHGTTVTLNNNSTGNTDSYHWLFGDGSSSSDTASSITHLYSNYGVNDTVYKTYLVAISPFGCHDTSEIDVRVYPYIYSAFSVDSSTLCSPVNLLIDPTVSIGVDTFYWSFSDVNQTFLDSSFMKLYDSKYYFDYTNDAHSVPDTLIASMYGMNRYGCTDTATNRTLIIYPEVHSDFTVDQNVICDSTDVLFTNNSSGYSLTYEWDFGNGTSMSDTTGLPFTKNYLNRSSQDTIYTVNLVVTSDYYCKDTATTSILVYPFVVADFSIDYSDNCSPLVVELVNASHGGYEYYWNFGDGTDSTMYTTASLYHTYENNTNHDTTYYLTLRVTNTQGCMDTIQRSVFIHSQVVADFVFDSPNEGCNPLTVSFLNNSLGKDLTYLWDFGNNTYSAAETPASKVYYNLTNQDTTYYVTLTATNLAGCDSSMTRPVTVYSKVTADFSIAQIDSCSPFKIDIDNASSGGITQFTWRYTPTDSIILYDFSDPDIPIYTNLTSAPEEYEIMLRAENSHGCSASKTDTVIIYPEIFADYTFDLNAGCQPLPVTFTNNTNIIAGTSFIWDFDDGISTTTTDAEHTFINYSHTDNVEYTVNLSATSLYGCSSDTSQVITVYPKPLADFSYPLALDCTPFELQFTNGSIGTSLSYAWDFDNGDTSTELDPVETFYNYGSTTTEMNVSLIVTTAYSCTDTITKVVGVFPGVEVDFTASVWDGCNPLEVAFDGSAINENDYYWYVDDKVISNIEDPYHTFINGSDTSRTFQVKFQAVSINGCSDDTTKEITVYAQPLAEFTPSPQVQDFNAITDMASINIENTTDYQSTWDYYWDFGDGTNSTEDAVSFDKDYFIWGDVSDENRILISMIATNSAHPQCTDTILHYIIINPPVPLVDLGDDVFGCMPLDVDFPSATKYVYSDGYVWDFGYEGISSTDPIPATLTYDTAGVYIVRLTVTGDGGENWDYKTVTVYPKPIVDFTFTPDYAWVRSQIEEGTPIKFYNTTQLGVAYSWNFDDGNYSTDFEPEHEYLDVGEYYVTLIAETEHGCYDTLTHEIPIIIDGRGSLTFPNAITIYADDPADEYYDADEANPRIFRPVAEGVDEYRLEIYNRWGELLYVSDDVNKGWNGYFDGSPVKQDVYVWRVAAKFTNGKPFVKAGDVTVLVKKP